MKKEWKFRLGGRIFLVPLKVKWFLIALAAAAAMSAGLYIKNSRKKAAETTQTVLLPTVQTGSPSPMPTASVAKGIWVYVVGEVRRPGVYPLTAGALVREAIEAAGGFSEEADKEAVNLVCVLSDNTMINVPAAGENTEGNTWLTPVSPEDPAPALSSKVNINTADVQALCTLSGIGQSTAEKILRYREENGPFTAIEEIMKVPGIKESKFAAIKEEICVE